MFCRFLNSPIRVMISLKFFYIILCKDNHCVKNVRIRSYSDPHFPAFRLNTRMRENADQNNSEQRHFLRSEQERKMMANLISFS